MSRDGFRTDYCSWHMANRLERWSSERLSRKRTITKPTSALEGGPQKDVFVMLIRQGDELAEYLSQSGSSTRVLQALPFLLPRIEAVNR